MDAQKGSRAGTGLRHARLAMQHLELVLELKTSILLSFEMSSY
jgi:hypothetical protein